MRNPGYSWKWQETSLLSKTSRLVLGPAQSLPGGAFPGVKRRELCSNCAAQDMLHELTLCGPASTGICTP